MDHNYSSMGKYDCARDDILHYLCTSDWANDSTGNSEAPTGYFWRIGNTWNDVKPENTEFNSLLADWFSFNSEVVDSPELRRELAGHFLVAQSDSGLVYVTEYPSEALLMQAYESLETIFNEWMGSEDD